MGHGGTRLSHITCALYSLSVSRSCWIFSPSIILPAFVSSPTTFRLQNNNIIIDAWTSLMVRKSHIYCTSIVTEKKKKRHRPPLQSVSDPKEMVSKSSSSTRSEKVCYRWLGFPYNQESSHTFLCIFIFCSFCVCCRCPSSWIWCWWWRCSRPYRHRGSCGHRDIWITRLRTSCKKLMKWSIKDGWKGWIESTYSLILQWESRMQRGRRCRYGSSASD